jgi:hypothetical protein
MKTLLRDIATRQYFQSLDKWTPDADEAHDFGLIARAVKFAHKASLTGLELILSLDSPEEAAALPFDMFRLRWSHPKCR